MRRVLATTAIVIIGGAGALAGCGDSTPAATTGSPPAATETAAGTTATSSTGQLDAATYVSDAFATLREQPYTSTRVTDQELDASALPAEIRDQAQKQAEEAGGTITSTTRYESPKRIEITQEIGGRTQQIILYDGAAYVSADGTTWVEATGAAGEAFSQASSLARINPAVLFTDITADGSGTVDGKSAQKFTAGINTAAAGDAVASVTGGLGDLGAGLGEALKIEEGSAVLMVDDAVGAISEMQVSMQIAFDLGAIAAASGEDAGDASGMALRITSTSTETITDFGGDITIQKPDATATVSTITELGEFLR
ncbi:MAG: hypothetical protein FJW92_01720 [Actinobacteria bacterium]|nr:hypothetical protein [Actinomycetota bacterium]